MSIEAEAAPRLALFKSIPAEFGIVCGVFKSFHTAIAIVSGSAPALTELRSFPIVPSRTNSAATEFQTAAASDSGDNGVNVDIVADIFPVAPMPPAS
jgi:hypothetical protein